MVQCQTADGRAGGREHARRPIHSREGRAGQGRGAGSSESGACLQAGHGTGHARRHQAPPAHQLVPQGSDEALIPDVGGVAAVWTQRAGLVTDLQRWPGKAGHGQDWCDFSISRRTWLVPARVAHPSPRIPWPTPPRAVPAECAARCAALSRCALAAPCTLSQSRRRGAAQPGYP